MSTAVLEVQDISRAFGGLKAVDDVSLDVCPGEILAVIGPNGAGKSTLMKLISGFERPDSGQVRICGADVTGRQPHRIARAGIARTFQDNVVFPDDTPVDALMVAQQGRGRANLVGQFLGTPKARAERIDMAAAARALLLEMELAALADTPCAALSHGHLRRLSVAVALATRPKVILLDEPFAGLNGAETNSAMRFIRQVANERGLGVVLVEHDMRAVMEISDRILVLNHGRAIAMGTPASIRKDSAVIEAYLGTYGETAEVGP